MQGAGCLTGARPVTQDIGEAFDHPEARAVRLAGANPPDRISLRDHIVAAEIGAFQQERGQTQRLRFNLAVELADRAAAGDDVDRILSYDRLTEAIAAALAESRVNLLETLAERVAARILAEPRAGRLFLRIEKLDRGPGALGVEVVRTRADYPGADRAGHPRPVIACLKGNVADLSALLDRLAARRAPVIVVPAPPDLPRPQADAPAAQLRIDLLAVEQAAWALAARDPRLTVVATRTEIDWAMKQGHMIVWAPSKLMLDTPGAPAEVGDGLAPALWLARELDARRLALHGFVAAPAGSRVPVEIL
jgi:7,8-dihydroneopterin aldolase/epimerase/oxygenase